MSTLEALGAANLRDLGGLPVAHDLRLRSGLLYRSEFPVYLDAGGAGVGLLGVRTVVDLRRDEEVAHETRPWTSWGVTHHQVALTARAASSWRAGYHGYLDHGPGRVVEAIGKIVAPGAMPALFFCAAGKDRTGMIAALLLAALGADRETIVADHLRTAAGIGSVVERLRPAPPYLEQLAGLTADDVAPHPGLVLRMLDWVEESGGAEEWLVQNGVDELHLRAFRQSILEPRAS